MFTLAAVMWAGVAVAGLSAATGYHLHLGDTSIAALIAAAASIVNGFILTRARKVQDHIRTEVAAIANDTELRARQIEELRSLSMERMRHIQRLERVSERLEAVESSMPGDYRAGGRRYYDPPAEGKSRGE